MSILKRSEIGNTQSIGCIIWLWYFIQFKEELHGLSLCFFCLSIATESFLTWGVYILRVLCCVLLLLRWSLHDSSHIDTSLEISGEIEFFDGCMSDSVLHDDFFWDHAWFRRVFCPEPPLAWYESLRKWEYSEYFHQLYGQQSRHQLFRGLFREIWT